MKIGAAGDTGPRWLRRLLLTIVAALLALAAAAWALSGVHLTLGPIRISAAGPLRVLLEAATVWLITEVAVPARRRALRITLAIGALLMAAIAESTPHRVGDGAEYVAMAVNLGRGQPPAMLPGERSALTRDMRALPGFADFTIEEPLVGRDGRQDFYHFWLYPLIVAPFARLAELAAVQVNYGFTAANLLLFGGFIAWLVRENRHESAALLAGGPLLWWIDKAHAEIFMFVAIALAVLLIEAWPVASLLLAAAAAAQNPAAYVLLVICLVSMMPGARGSRVPVLAVVLALAVASTAPIYYYWHLGVWSPLSSTIGHYRPGLRNVVTPLLDPNLGLVPYAPVLLLAAVAGTRQQSRRTLVVIVCAAIGFLVIFAESGNVNHGGTPGVSRYALWLLALAVPPIVDGCEWWRTRHAGIWRLAAAISIAFSVFVFRPAWVDRAGDSANWLASALWTRWPALDNPLPEVFAERVSGSGSDAAVPVATGGCEKVLIRGDGRDAWWPLPCAARPAPAMCIAAGALCYVNHDRFVMTPEQPTFIFEVSAEHAWTSSSMTRFNPLLRKLGDRLRFARLADRGGRVESVSELEHLYVVEGSTGAAAWVRSRPTGKGSIRVTVPVSSTLQLLDANTLEPASAPQSLVAGTHEVPLLTKDSVVIVVSDASTR